MAFMNISGNLVDLDQIAAVERMHDSYSDWVPGENGAYAVSKHIWIIRIRYRDGNWTDLEYDSREERDSIMEEIEDQLM